MKSPRSLTRIIGRGGQEVSVKVETLNSILEHSGFPFLNLLTIDVEGHELEVLQGLDLNVWKPKIIVAETWTTPHKEILCKYLEQFSYVCDAQKAYDCCFGRRS